MKKLLVFIFMLFLPVTSNYAQEEFIDNPVKFLLEAESQTFNLFKLVDLTYLRLKSITPMMDVSDSTNITIHGFLLLFDHVKTEDIPIDFYLYVEKPEKDKKDSGKIINVNFIHSKNKFVTRFFPHDPYLNYFQHEKFDYKKINEYIMTDNFKIGNLR